MMIKRLAAMLTTLIMCLSTLSMNAFAAEDNNYIEVTGIGYGPKNANIRSSFYKTYARQAARLDALRQLMEMFDLTGETTPEDVTSGDAIVRRSRLGLFGAVRNAKQIGKSKFNKDGSCEITMRFYLNGE